MIDVFSTIFLAKKASSINWKKPKMISHKFPTGELIMLGVGIVVFIHLFVLLA